MSSEKKPAWFGGIGWLAERPEALYEKSCNQNQTKQRANPLYHNRRRLQAAEDLCLE